MIRRGLQTTFALRYLNMAYSRADDGTTYRFNQESFLSPENIRGASGAHYPVERVMGLAHLLKKMARAGQEFEILSSDS